MSTRREGLFPPSSIGRVHGTSMKPLGSSESISHPLLSPTSSPPLTDPNPAKYLPYTPRQRVATPVITTTTLPAISVSPVASNVQQGPGKLNMKAAIQNLGVDVGSIGWAIFEKLATDGETEEWAEVWAALTKGNATLLLPLEKASNERITVNFVGDHIVFCDAEAVVTLSGLRGTIASSTLIIRSSVPPISPLFSLLLDPITRTTAMQALPPLTVPPPPTSSSSTQPPTYPTYILPSYTSSLPLLPRHKPPLPPRPLPLTAVRPLPLTARPSSAQGRISNPFAGLFGQRSGTPPPPSASSATTSNPLMTGVAGTSSSTAGVGGGVEKGEDPIMIPAYTITHALSGSRGALLEAVTLHLRLLLSEAANSGFAGINSGRDTTVPPWLVNRVLTFTRFLCPVDSSNSNFVSNLNDNNGGGHDTLPIEIDELATRIQGFYGELEGDVWDALASGDLSHKDSGGWGAEGEGGEGDKRDGGDEESDEDKVREIMARVERALCTVFYDRLFAPPADSTHDTLLKARIEAMNAAGVGLAQLDVDVSAFDVDVGGVEGVMADCGDALSLLDAARSPGEKAALLVKAHKVVVDGLSKFAPVKVEVGQGNEMDEKEKEAGNGNGINRASEYDSDILPPSTTASTPSVVFEPSSTEGTTPTSPVLTVSRLEDSSSASPSAPSPSSTSAYSQPQGAPGVEPKEPKRNEPKPISNDILLPLIILAVIKSNPHQLVSHLAFVQRFRCSVRGVASHRMRGGSGGGQGEESYCLINLMAVAEFLEGSGADLTPMLPSPAFSGAISSGLSQGQGDGDGTGPTFRGRVEQQVDAIAGSAGKVITGVVDSSFGVLRSLAFLPGHGHPSNAQASKASHTDTPSNSNSTTNTNNNANSNANANANQGATSPAKAPDAPWVRPSLGLLRRETGFSIASLAASLPGGGSFPGGRAKGGGGGGGGEEGQQLLPVSRPVSIKSGKSAGSVYEAEDDLDEEAVDAEVDEDNEDDDDDDDDDGEEDEDEEDNIDEAVEGDEQDGEEDGGEAEVHDARSIRSFERMLSDSSSVNSSTKSNTDRNTSRNTRKNGRSNTKNKSKKKQEKKQDGNGRKSLTDRLAQMPGLGRLASDVKASTSSPSSSHPPTINLPTQAYRSIPPDYSPSRARSPSPAPSLRSCNISHSLQSQRLPSTLPVPLLLRLPPPNRRFLECAEDGRDITLGEVAELVREYRRLVEGVRAVGGFDA